MPANLGSAEPPRLMLPYLPNDILRLIAQNLDTRSALRLMRTCKALRAAGEARAYSTLDLTGSWKVFLHPQLDELSDEEYQTRATVVDLKVKHALRMLEKYPKRCRNVTTVRLEPSDGQNTGSQRIRETILILQKVSAHLRCLEIRPLRSQRRWDGRQLSEFGTDNFFMALRHSSLLFPCLTKLQYVYPMEAAPPFDTWLGGMPNLAELHLSSADKSFSFVNPLSVPPSPVLHHLRRLTLDNLDGSETVLVQILCLAPNLEYLALRGHWTPSSQSTEMQQATLPLGRLKTLIALDGDSDGENLGMEVHLFRKVGLHFEEIAFNCGVCLEWEELYVQICFLPFSPKLNRLTVLTSVRAPLEDYALAPIARSPTKTYHIPAIFLHYIKRSPLLSSMLLLDLETPFPPPYAVAYSEPTYFIPSTEWIKEGHRGLVIRQYQTPSGTEPASFWHIRSLSRAIPNTFEGPLGLQRRICDWTEYKGRTVPRHILAAVYRVSGGDIESMEGGRGLSLDKAAWRILDEWRADAGDESEAEDDFDPATADDDQLSDEE